jgi:signal transduction histidine kinase
MGEPTNPVAQKIRGLKHDVRSPLYATRALMEAHLAQLNHCVVNSNQEVLTHTKTVLHEAISQLNGALQTIQKLSCISDSGTLEKETTANGRQDRSHVKASVGRIIRVAETMGYLENIRVFQDVPPALPPVLVKQEDLEEIFYNVIVNAAQALNGDGELRVECGLVATEFPSVSISFRDTGCGISSQCLPHIFEPFYSSRWESGRGSGFGLYIVKRLVERNHGEIRVTSHGHLGTTFTLTFPLAYARKAA